MDMDRESFLIEIPEYVIEQGSKRAGQDSPRFQAVLDMAEKFREANCTPFYLYDKEKDLLFCHSVETYYKNKLH
jgi:hypothetical protein